MKSGITYLAVLIAFVVLSPHGYSQTLFNRMNGINGVSIVVLGDLGDPRTCGVPLNDLRSAAYDPVDASPLTRSAAYNGAFLHIWVSVKPTNGGCAASYNVKAFSHEVVRLKGAKVAKIHNILLWEGKGLLIGPRGNFGRRMSETIEAMTQKFIVNWRLDQLSVQ